MIHSFLGKLMEKPTGQVELRVEEGSIKKVKLDLTLLTKYIIDFPRY